MELKDRSIRMELNRKDSLAASCKDKNSEIDLQKPGNLVPSGRISAAMTACVFIVFRGIADFVRKSILQKIRRSFFAGRTMESRPCCSGGSHEANWRLPTSQSAQTSQLKTAPNAVQHVQKLHWMGINCSKLVDRCNFK